MDRARNIFEEPIRIAFRPSPRITGLLAAAHLGAAAALFASGVPGWLTWSLLLPVVGSLCRTLVAFVRANAEPQLLLLDSRDRWRQLHAEHSERLQRGSCCCVSVWLIVLHLRDTAQRDRFFLLAGDNVDADSLRRFRVRLAFPLAGAD